MDPVATLAKTHGIKKVILVVSDRDAAIRNRRDLLRVGSWNA
jgi:hypothetical protein